MKKFWMVIREKEGAGTFIRHDTITDATNEAERLCKKEGGTFYVLEVVGAYMPETPPIKWVNL